VGVVNPFYELSQKVMFRSLIQSALPTRHRRRRDERGGTAVVEAALCIPIIIILMLGTLEVCAGIFLAESLTVCAYEAARAGVRRRSTAEDVRERALEALADRNVTLLDADESITITPNDFSELNALDEIRVTITAPTAGNSLYIFDTFVNRNVTASCSMVREFDE
jgi:Flp pilus assembly protein TadG